MAGLAAILGGLGITEKLYSYNRENFFFDKEQVLKKIYKGQDFKIKQWELYREDVRDLVGLTVSKMDNYLVINTLLLTFAVDLFTEGKPEPGKWPSHLQWLYALCNVGAFMYFLMSVWLSMHASIAAHSFGVRLLTQFVRLPVPTEKQLDDARAHAEDYEGQAKDIFRVPILKEQMKKLNKVMDRETMEDEAIGGDAGSDSGSNSGDQLSSPLALKRHVQLFRDLQVNWQSYDAYARVCMTMGVNQFLHACGYYTVGILGVENLAPGSSLSCIVMLTVASWLVMRLDLYLSKRFLALAAFLISCAPMLSLIVVTVDMSVASGSFQSACRAVLEPIIFLLHVVWILFIVQIAKADFVNGVALPTNFRAVTYLDVFGWIQPAISEVSLDEDMPRRRSSHMDLQDDLPSDGIIPAERELTETASSTVSSRNRSQPPPDLVDSLIRACMKEEAKLKTDFLRWSNKAVQEQLLENPFLEQSISQAKDRFEELQLQLQIVAESKGDFQPDSASSEVILDEKVWLKLEYNAGDGTMDYYYCTDTGDTVWSRPQEPENRISDVAPLEEDLNTFKEKVNSLVKLTQENESQNDLQSDLQNGEMGTNPREGDVLSRSIEAQEASRPFSLFRRPENEATTRRPPGQMPWRTFQQGSYCLVALWLVAFFWGILHIAGCDLALTPAKTNATESTLPLELVFEGKWPHGLFGPRSLACHNSIGEVVLVAEKYAVHQLRINNTQHGSDLLDTVLSQCLRRSPNFHAGGIREISLHCLEENRACSVVLFSTSGQSALSCPLSDGLGVEIIVHGKGWRGLTASSEPGQFWALGASSLALMHRRNGPTLQSSLKEELVPKLEIQNEVLSSASQVHYLTSKDGLGPDAILTLHPLGLLRAWSIEENRDPFTWQFSAQSVDRWTGLCTIGRTLYVSGLSHNGLPAGVWRASLPDDFFLASADATRR